jgi:hypothetical protein
MGVVMALLGACPQKRTSMEYKPSSGTGKRLLLTSVGEPFANVWVWADFISSMNEEGGVGTGCHEAFPSPSDTSSLFAPGFSPASRRGKRPGGRIVPGGVYMKNALYVFGIDSYSFRCLCLQGRRQSPEQQAPNGSDCVCFPAGPDRVFMAQISGRLYTLALNVNVSPFTAVL